MLIWELNISYCMEDKEKTGFLSLTAAGHFVIGWSHRSFLLQHVNYMTVFCQFNMSLTLCVNAMCKNLKKKKGQNMQFFFFFGKSAKIMRWPSGNCYIVIKFSSQTVPHACSHEMAWHYLAFTAQKNPCLRASALRRGSTIELDCSRRISLPWYINWEIQLRTIHHKQKQQAKQTALLCINKNTEL